MKSQTSLSSAICLFVGRKIPNKKKKSFEVNSNTQVVYATVDLLEGKYSPKLWSICCPPNLLKLSITIVSVSQLHYQSTIAMIVPIWHYGYGGLTVQKVIMALVLSFLNLDQLKKPSKLCICHLSTWRKFSSLLLEAILFVLSCLVSFTLWKTLTI